GWAPRKPGAAVLSDRGRSRISRSLSSGRPNGSSLWPARWQAPAGPGGSIRGTPAFNPRLLSSARAGAFLVTRSKVRLAGKRDAEILFAVETERVLGADDFRPFETVAHVEHARGPGRREGAFILDREMDLQVLVLIVRAGGHGSGGTPILLGGS